VKGGGGVWCFKIWFNPPFLYKCLYQVRVITVFSFPVVDIFCRLLYLYTFSLYENASLIIVSAETEYISTRSWYRNINFLRDRIRRYARASSNYSDFLKRHLHLRNRLLDQGYEKIRLIRSLRKFIFRYQDLVEIYIPFLQKRENLWF
jgi:hypothetical protein